MGGDPKRKAREILVRRAVRKYTPQFAERIEVWLFAGFGKNELNVRIFSSHFSLTLQSVTRDVLRYPP